MQYQPTYSPYQMGMYGQYQNQFQNQPQHQEITRVSGKNGADMYQMAPNSSVLLLDEIDPIVWLKTTDGAGYATLVPYSITPYKPEEPVDLQSLEERVSKIEEALSSERKSNTSQAKHSESHAAESRKS